MGLIMLPSSLAISCSLLGRSARVFILSCVGDYAVYDTALYLALLQLLDGVLQYTRGRYCIVITERESRGSLQIVVEAFVHSVCLGCAVDDVVLRTTYSTAGLAHFAAQVGYLLNGQSAIVEHYNRLRLFELSRISSTCFALTSIFAGFAIGFTSLQNENPLPKTKDESLLNKLAFTSAGN